MRLKVKQIAEQQGLDIYILVSRTKLSLTTLQKLWKDLTVDVPNTDTITLERVAQALNVEVRDLIAS